MKQSEIDALKACAEEIKELANKLLGIVESLPLSEEFHADLTDAHYEFNVAARALCAAPDAVLNKLNRYLQKKLLLNPNDS